MCVTSGLRCVQSYLMSSHYRQGAFFTEATMEGVRDAIAGARGFMAEAAFDPWSNICLGDHDSFVSRYTVLLEEYLANKKKSFRRGFSDAVRRDRQSSVASASTGSESAECV